MSSTVSFVDYDNTYGMYTLTTTSPTYNLVIDMSLLPVPSPGPFTDPIKRTVEVTDGTNSVAVTALDETVTLYLYDCEYDFATPADNLELVQSEETNPNFEDPVFRYQIGSGDYSLPVTIPSPQWSDLEGTPLAS